jgi:TctA family transporter
MIFMFFNLSILIPLFSNFAKVLILTFAVVALISLCRSKLLGILFTVFGLILGKVGYDNLFQTRILTVDYSNLLDAGIPFISVFIGLVVLPQLWDLIKNKTKVDYTPDWNDVTLFKRIKLLLQFPYIYSVMRGTVIGIFTGMIPGISYAISSTSAAAVEKTISVFNKDAKRDTNFKCVVSAETANNTASIVVLIPLLMLALPIIPSEAIIFSIAETKGFGIATSQRFLETYGMTIFWVLLFANTVNWILSGIFYVMVARFYFLVKDYIYYFLFVAIIFVNYYAASLTNGELLATIFLLIFFILGVIVKDVNTKLTMVFAFFLADPMINEFYRFWLLNT